MPALVRLRGLPELLGVSLRSGSLRLYAPEPEKLIARWREHWPFPDLRLLGERWVEPDMEDVFTAYSQGYHGVLTKLDFMKWLSFEALPASRTKNSCTSIAIGGCCCLCLRYPPLFTLLFGHAFETGELTGVPSLLVNQDNTPRAQEFVDIISKNKTFAWRHGSPECKRRRRFDCSRRASNARHPSRVE